MFKKYLITGLLIWVPLAITFWVLDLIVTSMDRFLPRQFTSDTLFGVHIPGFGVIAVFAVVFLTGLLAANFIGRQLVAFWEGLLRRIPLVRSIYSSVKQVSDTVLAPNGQAFRKALLVQYPRSGVWTIAFQTGTPNEEVATLINDSLVSVYVPTTPNPTSGFFLMMNRTEVIELTMTVDEALKYVVSMGVVAPGTNPKPGRKDAGPPPRAKRGSRTEKNL
jgi:uncharacterized membrane protein